MELEKVTAVIRPRGAWEAVDLGFRMVLSDARRIYTALGLIMLPLYVGIVAIAAMAGRVDAAMIVLWWLKPVFDRMVLALLSRSLFGDRPGLTQSLRYAVQAAFGAGIVQALTLYRLDPARSLNLPVWQLEQLRGRQRWHRARILHRDTWGVATVLTLFCFTLEIIGLLCVFAVIGMLIPPELDVGVTYLHQFFLGNEEPLFLTLLYIAIYGCTLWLVEPLFVGGGFALYINRRTVLEAWDIELAFRRLAARHAPAGLAAMLLVLLFPVVLVAPAPAQAKAQVQVPDDSAPVARYSPAHAAPAGNGDPVALINEVLAHPDFETYETRTQWEPHYHDNVALEDGDAALSRWLLNAIARVGEALVWLVILALAVLLWLRREWLWSFIQPNAATATDTPRAQARHTQLPVQASLPADIPAAVQALWHENRFVEATSLLYRGAIRELKEQHNVTLGNSATESDWLVAAQRNAPGSVADFFAAITSAWQQTAYAQHAPASDRLLSLCRQWTDTFGDAA